MSEKLNINELFKTKLEDKEITPSASVWDKTIRVTRRKQFMRFNPARFNVYYLAGTLIVAGGLSAVLLTDGVKQTPIPGQARDDSAQLRAEESVIQTPNPGPEASLNTIPETRNTQHTTRTPSAEASLKEEPATRNAQHVTRTPSAVASPMDVASAKSMAKAEPTTPPPLVKTLIVYFTPSVREGCAPLEVEFYNASVNAEAYLWNFGANQPATRNAKPVTIFSDPGTYLVTLSASGPDGLTQSHSEQITVHPSPEAEFEIVDDAIYNYSIGATEYHWSILPEGSEPIPYSDEFQPSLDLSQINMQPATRNPQHVTRNTQPPTRNPQLSLFVSNQHGCSDTMSMALPAPKEPTLTFPSAFSPTGPSGGTYNPNETNNDIFHPVYSEMPVEYSLTIYNRAGELIFRTNDITVGWDGYHQQAPAASGVYIWKCTGRWTNGQSFTYQGDLTLVRNDL
jgi:PKD repeat protein